MTGMCCARRTRPWRWMVLLLALAAPAAATAPGQFRYERPVIPAGPGPNRLVLDAAVLSGATPITYATAGGDLQPIFVSGLDDLRLFDAKGQEVPYLLIAPPSPAPRWHQGTVLPVAATKETSGFEVDLGAVAPVDQLRLDGLPPPFLKRLRLEGGGDRTHWTVLVADGTLFNLPEERLTRTTLTFPGGEFRYLRVTWDDRKSAVVPPPPAVFARLGVKPAAAPPAEEPLDFERRPSEPGTSRFRIRLPGPHLPITGLTLACGGGHLLRRAEVREPRCAGDNVTRQVLGGHTLRRIARDDLTAADLRIPMTRPLGAELELVVEDGDNPPFELTGVTAEFGPLPWIYFESAAGETLTARFGDRKLGRPRYDLEAVRNTVDPARPVPARWGERRVLTGTEAVPPDGGPLPSTAGPLAIKPFRFARPIRDGATGFSALRLDAAILAHSTDLSDLRIVANANEQVPYLLERLDEPLVVELAALAPIPRSETGDQPGLSRYRLALPYDTLPAARLVMKTTARVFERRLSITVERPAVDARSTPRTERIVETIWRHTDPDSAVPPLLINLPPLRTATATLVVDEGDNSALPLGAPELLLPAYRLRFFRPTTPDVQLLYGNPDIGRPRYDLVLLAPRLIGAAAHEAVLGPEGPPRPTAAGNGDTIDRQALVFWGALIVAVLVLLALIARLVGTSGRADQA